MIEFWFSVIIVNMLFRVPWFRFIFFYLASSTLIRFIYLLVKLGGLLLQRVSIVVIVIVLGICFDPSWKQLNVILPYGMKISCVIWNLIECIAGRNILRRQVRTFPFSIASFLLFISVSTVLASFLQSIYHLISISLKKNQATVSFH